MKIDPTIEAPLRSALWYAINEDPEGAGEQLAPLGAEDLATALYYSWFAIGYVVGDRYGEPGGEWDTAETELERGSRELAEQTVSDVANWFELGSVEQVATFIQACATGALATEIPEGIDVERLPQLSVIAGGSLLDRCRPEGTEWFEYLDRIWNFAEQQPAP